jgi:hypothetical protein
MIVGSLLKPGSGETETVAEATASVTTGGI